MECSFKVQIIGSQILIKSETFALKQDLQYPPGGGGGWSRDYWYLGEKNLDYWYLRSQKIVFGPAEGRKIWEI